MKFPFSKNRLFLLVFFISALFFLTNVEKAYACTGTAVLTTTDWQYTIPYASIDYGCQPPSSSINTLPFSTNYSSYSTLPFNASYWYYASCYNCGTDYWADSYQCSGSTQQRLYHSRGCSAGDCYDNTSWQTYSACATAGTCQTGGGCSGGSCVTVSNVPAGQDTNNQCTASYNACSGTSKIGPDGNCNGAGACNTSGASSDCGGPYDNAVYQCNGAQPQQQHEDRGCTGAGVCYGPNASWQNYGSACAVAGACQTGGGCTGAGSCVGIGNAAANALDPLCNGYTCNGTGACRTNCKGTSTPCATPCYMCTAIVTYGFCVVNTGANCF